MRLPTMRSSSATASSSGRRNWLAKAARPRAVRSSPSGIELGVEARDGEADPLRRVPVRVVGSDLRLEGRRDLFEARSGRRRLANAAAHVLEVRANVADQLRTADLAVARDDDLGAERRQAAEHFDPPAPVDVHVVWWEPGEDREEARLDQVSGEEDARFRQKHDLVASRVCQPEMVELDLETAEVEGHAILVDLVRLDQLDAFQLLGDGIAERA